MIETFSIVKQEVPMTQEKGSPLRERMMEEMRNAGYKIGRMVLSFLHLGSLLSLCDPP